MTNITMTDLVRAKKGKLGAQFWAIFEECKSSGKDAVRQYMEMAEVWKRVIDRYPNELQMALTSQGTLYELFRKTSCLSPIFIAHSQTSLRLSSRKRSPACLEWKEATRSIRHSPSCAHFIISVSAT